MKRRWMPVAVAVGLIGGVGCSLADQPGLHHPVPAVAACPPGEVVVAAGEPVGCDLIGGANTLTEVGGTEAACDAGGGRWAAGGCSLLDF